MSKRFTSYFQFNTLPNYMIDDFQCRHAPKLCKPYPQQNVFKMHNTDLCEFPLREPCVRSPPLHGWQLSPSSGPKLPSTSSGPKLPDTSNQGSNNHINNSQRQPKLMTKTTTKAHWKHEDRYRLVVSSTEACSNNLIRRQRPDLDYPYQILHNKHFLTSSELCWLRKSVHSWLGAFMDNTNNCEYATLDGANEY